MKAIESNDKDFASQAQRTGVVQQIFWSSLAPPILILMHRLYWTAHMDEQSPFLLWTETCNVLHNFYPSSQLYSLEIKGSGSLPRSFYFKVWGFHSSFGIPGDVVMHYRNAASMKTPSLYSPSSHSGCRCKWRDEDSWSIFRLHQPTSNAFYRWDPFFKAFAAPAVWTACELPLWVTSNPAKKNVLSVSYPPFISSRVSAIELKFVNREAPQSLRLGLRMGGKEA